VVKALAPRAGRGRAPRQREGEGQRATKPRADAIVVLGCPSMSRLMQRLDRGVRLFQKGAAPLLLLSGGGIGAVPEAQLMRRLALARGVPASALLVEPESGDTVGNAHEAARLLGARGRRSVWLVSDRVHLPRAILLFRLAGLRVTGWAAPRPSSIWWEIGRALRECAALPWSLARAVFVLRRG
jgi:uncharacterized SAM-binding protein YcdF (DUF218 family)